MVSLSLLTKNSPKAPRIIIHSDPGVGKTTFAACSDNPVFIQTEDGLGGLHATCFPLAKSFSDVIGAISALFTENHNFRTCVIDSLDWLEPLIYAEVCKVNNISNIEKLPYGRGYVEALGYWRTFFDGITALRDCKNMIIIMIAHSEKRRVEDPTMPAYDCWDLKLHKRSAALAEEFADIILFACMQANTVTEDKGFNQSRTRVTTTGNRIIHSTGHPAFLAKTRFPLPSPLPLAWADFAAAMWPAAKQSAATRQPQSN